MNGLSTGLESLDSMDREDTKANEDVRSRLDIRSTIRIDPESDEFTYQQPVNPTSITKGSNTNHVPITINFGGMTLLIMIVLIVALIIVLGGCGLVMGLNLAKQDQMDRDFRADKQQKALLERRDIDLETYLQLNGIKIPGDDTHGPTGNLQRMLPKEKSNGRR